jgi:hypothetical protein
MVYKQPIHGALYFIRGLHLQDFGFPRVRIPMHSCKQSKLTVKSEDIKIEDEKAPSLREIVDEPTSQLAKQFKWKKINYKTFLPKHNPIVAYIVAKTNNM